MHVSSLSQNGPRGTARLHFIVLPQLDCGWFNENLLGLFLLLFLDLDHFTVSVKTTFRADGVRKAHAAAVFAGHEVLRLDGIMGAAAVAAALRVFAFRLWGHSVLLFYMQSPGKARRDFQTSGQIISAGGSDVKPEPL